MLTAMEEIPSPSRLRRVLTGPLGVALAAALAVATGLGIYAAETPGTVTIQAAASGVASTTSTTRTSTPHTQITPPTTPPTLPSLPRTGTLSSGTSDLAGLFAPETPPALSVSCPGVVSSGAATAAASFGHQASAGSSPLARWSVDYGDGKHYEAAAGAGTEQAVFHHTYTASGSYIFSVTLTDANGLWAFDNCVFSWFKPYVSTTPLPWPVTPPTVSTPGSSVPSSTTPTYTTPDLSVPGGGTSTYPPGGYNDQGCPKDQWTNGYTRKDGTYVNGYWHNSPTDGCGGG